MSEEAVKSRLEKEELVVPPGTEKKCFENLWVQGVVLGHDWPGPWLDDKHEVWLLVRERNGFQVFLQGKNFSIPPSSLPHPGNYKQKRSKRSTREA